MDSSLKEITLKSFMKQIPSEVFEELQKEALKDLDHTKKRNISIVLYSLHSADSIAYVFHTFENATKAELPSLMEHFPNDELIEQYNVSLFHLLVEEHCEELKKNGHEQLIKDMDEYYNSVILSGIRGPETKSNWDFKISPEVIKHLYTEILTYKDLIEDINKVQEELFTVCIKDEESWNYVKKQLLQC